MPNDDSSKELEPEVKTIITEVVQGRKSWKRSKGERVWPPELEAALIEGNDILFYFVISIKHHPIGLQKYEPVDSRETRMLGRFPMRNRFLSDYIFNKTGQSRTAKQVGSRLQQLRDPRSGKRRRSSSLYLFLYLSLMAFTSDELVVA
jgi:transcriptional enhancer factor